MKTENLAAIEKNIISNICLCERLNRLPRTHCVHRNERQYGRTVNLVKDWFLQQLDVEMSIEQQIAFVSRTEISRWAQALLGWNGWEQFLDQVMERNADSGVIKAFILRKYLEDRVILEMRTMLGREDSVFANCYPGERWERKKGYADFDRRLFDFLTTCRGKSPAQILMEVDLQGYDWTWDMVRYIGMGSQWFPLLKKLLCHKIESVAEFASPHVIAKFVLCNDFLWCFCEETISFYQIIGVIAKHWPSAFSDFYRRQIKSSLFCHH